MDPLCLCRHSKSTHKDGGGCKFYEQWISPDGTWAGEMFCICQSFRLAEIETEEVVQINEQS